MKKRWMRSAAAVLSLILAVSPIGSGSIYAEPISAEEAVIEETEPDSMEEVPAVVEENESLGVDATVSQNVTSDYDGMEIPPTNYIDDGFTAPSVGDAIDELVGADLPTSYRATPEERTDLTPVRSQNPYGDCWTFGTLAAGEQTFLKNSENQTVSNTNLAEIQLAWFNFNDNTSTPYGDISQDTTEVTFDDEELTESEKARNIYNMGGSAIYAAWTLARGIGSANEFETPDLAYENFTDEYDTYGLDNSYARIADATLHDFYAINIKEDPELAKQMILDYGTITASYYHDNANYANNNATASNYRKDKSFCDKHTGTNHAVAIVGWDDDYAVSNFTGAVKPQNPGAWLVRNSWGPNWGDDGGYFWMSYETQSLTNNYVMNMEPTDANERNYQYDGAMYLTSCPLKSGGSVCNVFTAAGTAEPDKKEVLDRVAVGIADSNVNYSIQIYKNPTKASDPTTGTAMLLTPAEGVLAVAGYHTIDLPKELRMEKNDKFAVVITLTGEGGSDVHCWGEHTSSRTVKDSDNQASVVGSCTSTAHIDAGQSYRKYAANNSWQDLYTEKNVSGNLRIKAFTRLVDYIPDTAVSMNKTSLSLGKGEQETLSANVLPENATDQEIVWSSSDERIATVGTDGTVTGVKVGSAVITAASLSGHTAECSVSVAAARATVHFQTSGGIQIEDRRYSIGERFGELPDPVREGYDFKGWYLDSGCTSSKRVTESSVVPDQAQFTLYAKWKAAPYIITFDAGNGETPEIMNYEGDDTFGTMPEPTYGSRTFGGWYTEENGQGTKLTSEMKVSQLERTATVYAHWIFVPCVSVSGNDSVSVNIGGKITNRAVLSPENATCEGITYRSLDTGIFTIDQNGRITGKKYGSAEGVISAKVMDVSGNDVVKEYRFRVNVEDTTIAIEAATSQSTAKIGDMVDKSAIAVYACNQSGRSRISENQFTISPEVIANKGDNSITVTYQNFTTTLNIIGTDSSVSEDTPKNYAPRMQQKSVVVNRSLAKQGSFIMEPASGIESMLIDDSFYVKEGESYTAQSDLKVTNVEENEYEITVSDSYKKGKKTLYVKADVTAKGTSQSYYVPITVNVVSKLPVIKLKADAMNVFYTDEQNRTSPLMITNKSGVTITDISLDDEMSKWFQIEKNPATGSYELRYEPVTEVTSVKGIVKKGKVKISIEGYGEPVETALSVSVKMKAPSIKSLESPATLNLLQNSSYDKTIYIVDKNGTEQLMETVELADSDIRSYFQSVSVSEDNIVLSVKNSAKEYFAKTRSVKLNVCGDNWLYARPVSVKFRMTESKPLAGLSAKQITFNRSYQGAKAAVYLDLDTDLGDNGYLLNASSIDCMGENAVNAPIVTAAECSNTRYRLTAAVTKSTRAGTYVYTVIPQLADGTDLNTLSFKVKVTENTKQPQIVLKTVKGSKLDVLMGEDAAVSYTLTCKNINAKVTDVSVADDTSIFQAGLVSELDGKQVMEIGLKENKTVSAKQTYEIPLTYTICDVGNKKQAISGLVKIKAVEGSFKFALSVPSAQLSKGVVGSYVEQKAGITSPEGAEFATLKNVSANIPEGAFYVFTSPITGKIRISLRDGSKVVTGKTYTFTFAATAGNGSKVAKQKVKITITD